MDQVVFVRFFFKLQREKKDQGVIMQDGSTACKVCQKNVAVKGVKTLNMFSRLQDNGECAMTGLIIFMLT